YLYPPFLFVLLLYPPFTCFPYTTLFRSSLSTAMTLKSSATCTTAGPTSRRRDSAKFETESERLARRVRRYRTRRVMCPESAHTHGRESAQYHHHLLAE